MRIVAQNPKRNATVAALVLAGAVLTWCCLRKSDASATPPAAPPPPAATATPPAPAPVPPGPSAAAAATANATAPSGTESVPTESATTARITFTTVPAVAATVTWGRKLLGKIGPRQALVVVRPRDSGPLDVVVKAYGYMPVTTRAHTFADSRVVVKLTPPDQKTTLIGYRAPLDAGVELGSDGLPIDGGVLPPATP
jgi:hypothetical protein